MIAVLALPAAAGAHETLHEVQRGRAVAIRAYHADGEAMAGEPYEVYSPADPKLPWQTGFTDRAGWLAFVPQAAGTWRVKVLDESGHGLDLRVEASGAEAAGAATVSRVWSAAFVLRPLLGAAIIAAVFAALLLAYRRRGGAP